MKKFRFLSVLLILILCGCDCEYEISIYDNKYKEKLRVVENDLSIVDTTLDSGFTVREAFDSLFYEDEFSDTNSKYKSLENNSQIGFEYSDYDFNSILESSVVGQCYLNPYFDKVDNVVTFRTGVDFECYEYFKNLQDIKVTFKTNHEVISTNADEEYDGKYVWYITKNGNKDIQVSYYTDKVKKGINIPLVVFGSMAIIIVLVVVIFISKKNKADRL